MMPIVKKIQEINDQFFMSVAQSLFTYLQVNAAKEDEKIVRLHIGLEDPKDLIEDLRKSLKFIK